MSTKAEAIQALEREIAKTVSRFGFSSHSKEFAKRKIAVTEWLNNFEIAEIRDALALASAVTYVSAEQMNQSIHDAAEMLRRLLGNALTGAHFFQLGDSPAESGGNFLYILRKALRLNEKAFPSASPKPFLKGTNPIVFVDDLVGTGSQAISFSNQYLKDANAPAYYCAMYALEDGLKHVREKGAYVSAFSPNIVYESDKAFAQDGPLSADPQLRERLRTLAQKYGERLYPKHPLGYRNSQLLLAFQHNVPNNTLPIIWAGPESESSPAIPWHPLFPRFKVVPPPERPKTDSSASKGCRAAEAGPHFQALSTYTEVAAALLLLCDQYSDGSWGRTLYRASGRAFTSDTAVGTDGSAFQKRALSITSWACQSLIKSLDGHQYQFVDRSRSFVFSHYDTNTRMFGNIYTVQSGAPSVPRDDIFLANPRHTATALKMIEGCDGLTDIVYDSTVALSESECDGGGWAERQGSEPNCLTTSYVIDYLSKVASKKKYRTRFGEAKWTTITASLSRGYAWLAESLGTGGFWQYENQIAFSPFYTATVLAFCPDISHRYPSVAKRAVSALLETRRQGRVSYELGSYSSISTTALLAFALIRMKDKRRSVRVVGELCEAINTYFSTVDGIGRNYTVLDSIFTLALANSLGMSEKGRLAVVDLADQYDNFFSSADASESFPAAFDVGADSVLRSALDRIGEVHRSAP